MMNTPEPTGIGFQVSSGTLQKLGPLFLAAVFGVTSGGGASTWFDVTGAKAFKDGVAEQVSHIEELEEKVVALEAQNKQLLELLNGRTFWIETDE